MDEANIPIFSIYLRIRFYNKPEMKTMNILAPVMALLGISGCTGFKTVPVQEFEKLAADGQVQLVDVRTPEEFAEGHLTGSVNIDWYDEAFLSKAEQALDKSKAVAVYCRSGKRSAAAAAALTKAGFTTYNLKGGFLAWNEAGNLVVKDLPYEMDSFKTASGKQVRFYALVHASILIEYDGLEILVDPVRKLGEKTIDYSIFPKPDHILVTHEHGDHFDKEFLTANAKDKLITNARCAEMLGFGKTMQNGDVLELRNDIKVEAVPAYNYTEGHTRFHPKGRDNGYILTLDGLRIYIAGDTEDIPEMSGIKDIDIAFLPCNQPYTMTPDQLVKAARTVQPKVLFPYHYSATDVSGIPAALQGIDVRIRQYQ